MTDYAAARLNMVESQVRTADVTDRRVIAAMSHLAREAFLPADKRSIAYMDEDVLIGHFGDPPAARYLMEPMPFARLLQAAEVSRNDLVLDVGCATGYSSAALAMLAGSVVALECDESLAQTANEVLLQQGIDNVAVVTGPLQEGYPAEGPYDVIFLGGAVSEVPQTLLDQLADDGRLVGVVSEAPVGRATVFVRHQGVVSERVLFDATTPPLPGFAREPGFVF